jgi:adenine-specific DNA-methyltransferase
MLNMAVRNTGKLIREKSKSENIRLGRLFTKKDTARLMASMIELDKSKTAYTVLDPAAGTGILSAAVIEHICKNAPEVKQIFLTCYEPDPTFLPSLEDNLERIRKRCRHDYDVRLFTTVYDENYITGVKNHYTVTFFDTVEDKFDIIIANPPSYMVEKGSEEAECAGCVTMCRISAVFVFMKIMAEHLEKGGKMAVLVPTTYATAQSLSAIRKTVSELLTIKKIHLFVGKSKNQKRAVPLKKNIIISFEEKCESREVVISTSTDFGTPEKTTVLPTLPYGFVVDEKDGSLTLPKSVEDTKIVKYIGSFPETLESLGLRLRTGLVIDSKCKKILFDEPVPGSIPLIRLNAIKNSGISFPAPGVKNQYLMPVTPSLFQKNKNLIIIKRVPAKSDDRFLNAAIYFAAQRPSNPYISTHNKINFIDTKERKDELSARFAFGLFALLNSTIYDRYLSIISKSKQINAKEMKSLPLPPKNLIENIGMRLMACKQYSVTACDQIVNPTLHIIEKN